MTDAREQFDSEHVNENDADPTRPYVCRNAQALLCRRIQE